MKRFRPVRMLVLAGAVLILSTGLAAASSTRTADTAPSNTALPTISGSAAQGASLSASPGSWSGTTPITFTYVWDRCDNTGANCVAISGATAQTYTITSDDVGYTVRIDVTAHNSAGTADATSDQTAVVTGATPPANTAAPHITGATTVGSSESGSAGTWTGTAPITYGYQWLRCDTNGSSCGNISGATSTTYVLATSDSGHTIRFQVTATNTGGTGQATSDATDTVEVGPPVNSVAPKISGTTVLGRVLSTTGGTWSSPTSISYTIAWQRCDANGGNCSNIQNASSASYTLTTADVGQTLRVVVVAKNSAGSTQVASATVGPITLTGTTTTTSTTTTTTTTPPPGGTTKLPNGETSIAAANVPATDRLGITRVTYAPTRIVGRAPVTMTVKVVDANNYDVAGALVYVIGLPYGWARITPESATAADGTVSLTITPTKHMPRKGSLVLFVRARTPQGSSLTGSSNRRLVQVSIRP